MCSCKTIFHTQTNSSLTDTGSNLGWSPPPLHWGEGEAHLPTQGSETKSPARYCSREDFLTAPNPKSTSLPSCGTGFTRSFCPHDLLFPRLYFYFFAVSRGKGSNSHRYPRGKAGSFWQRKITLTKYFANPLLTICYPRQEKAHYSPKNSLLSLGQPRPGSGQLRIYSQTSKETRSPWRVSHEVLWWKEK